MPHSILNDITSHLKIERLEYDFSSKETEVDMSFSVGTFLHAFVITHEGSYSTTTVPEESRTELAYSTPISSFWDIQVGVRSNYSHDSSDTSYLSLVFQGLSYSFIETTIGLYLNEDEILYRQELVKEYAIDNYTEMVLRFEVELEKDEISIESGLRILFPIDTESYFYTGVELRSISQPISDTTSDLAILIGFHIGSSW